MEKIKQEKVSIVGSGLIGRSFSMLFASRGYQVYLYDINNEQVAEALVDIKNQLISLEKIGSLKGELTAEEQMNCIKSAASLEECVSRSKHVQECIPENLELKRKIFKEIDAFVDADTVLSSSTSCIMPSEFTKDLINKASCIVSHPLNPPYFVPAIEIVPSPWTSKNVMQKTVTLWEQLGFVPIKFSREYPGFAVNRIQYAILNACWELVNDDVLSVEDVDNVVKEGLAMRYAFCGPFETIHLNAEGTEEYIKKYGKTINSISNTFGPVPSWRAIDAEKIIKESKNLIPLSELAERRKLRDEKLIALSKLKKEMKEKND